MSSRGFDSTFHNGFTAPAPPCWIHEWTIPLRFGSEGCNGGKRSQEGSQWSLMISSDESKIKNMTGEYGFALTVLFNVSEHERSNTTLRWRVISPEMYITIRFISVQIYSINWSVLLKGQSTPVNKVLWIQTRQRQCSNSLYFIWSMLCPCAATSEAQIRQFGEAVL